jgi:hypothetical protein
MRQVDLSHTEGIKQVATNQFKKLQAGYPVELHGSLYLILSISGCVRVRPSDNSDDLIIARMHLLKLTKSGNYSKSKDAFCFTYIRMSGLVENDFRVVNDLWSKSHRAIQEYNEVVRRGRDTSFNRHWAFDISLERGIAAENAYWAERSFFPGWHR